MSRELTRRMRKTRETRTHDIWNRFLVALLQGQLGNCHLTVSFSAPFYLQRVDLNPRDREKCTPLLLAAAHGCSAVVSLLLENGADVTCEDEKRRTALHWAVGQDKTIERLLKVISCSVALAGLTLGKAYPHA